MIDWEDYAACKGEPIDTFFPKAGDGYTKALRICFRCPVRVACLREALEVESAYRGGRAIRAGMFGGMTPYERSNISGGNSTHSASECQTIEACTS